MIPVHERYNWSLHSWQEWRGSRQLGPASETPECADCALLSSILSLNPIVALERSSAWPGLEIKFLSASVKGYGKATYLASKERNSFRDRLYDLAPSSGALSWRRCVRVRPSDECWSRWK